MSRKQHLRDGCMPMTGRAEHGRVPIVVLKIDVIAESNQLLRDGQMPRLGCAVKGRIPIRVVTAVVGEGLCAWHRQERCNRRCIARCRGV